MKPRNYTVYFTVFNKKMKTTILAESEEEAKQKILSKVIFDKITENKEDSFNHVMDIIEDMCNFFDKK